MLRPFYWAEFRVVHGFSCGVNIAAYTDVWFIGFKLEFSPIFNVWMLKLLGNVSYWCHIFVRHATYWCLTTFSAV